MQSKNGHRKLLEQLRADGIRYIFGNPGSSEEGLLAELSQFPEIEYVLCLQEAAVVSMADGYAQASRGPAVVQLHTGVGLGTALGGIYHALRRNTPLLVVAGEAGVAYDALEAHMAVDLVGLARPVTKYAARALHPQSLLRLVRRCLKIASTPPYGPVFLALPQDVLDANNDEPVVPTVVPQTRVVPDPTIVASIAEMLVAAERPLILTGDGIAHAEAQSELARVAEILGAPVWGAMASEVNLPWTHPLYCGLTGHMFGEASARIVGDADAILICGTYVFPEVFPSLTSPFSANAKVIHIDLDAHAIGKNHPVTLGVTSDPKLSLAQVADALERRMTDVQKSAAAARGALVGAQNAATRDAALAEDRRTRDAMPMHMSAFAEALARRLPSDAIVFDESLTYLSELTRWLVPGDPGSFFQTPGGTLGIGIPGAIGAKLAHPHRTVVGFTGDGGAMYTYQALWTAARYGIHAKFVVCNNHSYRLLKLNLLDYWRRHDLPPDQFPAFPQSFDIGEPHPDFVGLAAALGVPAQRVSEPIQIDSAISDMLGSEAPFLLELVLEGDVPTAHVASAAPHSMPASAAAPCS